MLGTNMADAAGRANGTTLAASKTLNICVKPDGSWQYSGEFSVWNSGAVLTQGFDALDCIQTKVGGEQFANAVPELCTDVFVPPLVEVLPGTSELTAVVYKYVIEGQALDPLYIRNSVELSILNHSGSVGTPKGPNPKATWNSGEPLPCPVDDDDDLGCTYTQGYWGNKPNVVWPAPYVRTDPFYPLINGAAVVSWDAEMHAKVGDAPGYHTLAQQYIAAVLNAANGAFVPEGIEDILELADDWLATHTPADCAKSLGNGACGLQKTWNGILTTYNEGEATEGPPHCGDE